MGHNVSINVPFERTALRRAADMLSGMADDLAVTAEPIAEEVAEEEKPVGCGSDMRDTVASEVFKPVEQEVTVPPADDEPVAPATTATGVELDANGLPWDGRIHSSNRGLMADGTWKYKRGVDRDKLVPEVEAELRALMGVPTPDPAMATIEAEGEADDGGARPHVAPPHSAGGIVNNQTDHPVAVTAAPPPPAAPAGTGSAITTFPDLLKAIGAAKIPVETQTTACQTVGLRALSMLPARPDLIPAVAAELGL